MANANFISPPAVIEAGKFRFLVSDAPTDSNVMRYLEVFKKENVTQVVRVCEPTYPSSTFTDAGINFLDLKFPDGDVPPESVLDDWLKNVGQHFSEVKEGEKIPSIAVHCIAGLGRAPLLVALALIEYRGMEPLDAVDFIRRQRRGAINAKQLRYMEAYKPRTRSRKPPCTIL